jgi:hypothetical protein
MQHLVREAISQGRDAVDPAVLAAQVRLFRSAVLAGRPRRSASARRCGPARSARAAAAHQPRTAPGRPGPAPVSRQSSGVPSCVGSYTVEITVPSVRLARADASGSGRSLPLSVAGPAWCAARDGQLCGWFGVCRPHNRTLAPPEEAEVPGVSLTGGRLYRQMEVIATRGS